MKRTGWPALVIPVLLIAASTNAGARPVPRPLQRIPPLRACQHVPGARCGSIEVLLDRMDPSVGTIKIGFELFRRTNRSRPKLGTIVAVEGGPGFSTTASREYFRELFRPLLDRRDLLLVDNRGTGRSDPILCRPLQSYTGNAIEAVGKCGRRLGDTSDLYGSGNAADDLAEVLDHLEIDRIDLYGDSYGTFFSQTFAVRHPERVRTIVLDAAYFVAGTDPFYTDTNRSLRDAFRYVCERRPECRGRQGGPMRRIARLAALLRKEPIRGRAPDADGNFARVEVDVGGLIYLVTSAATSPSIYRELDAAARAALRDRRSYEKPLLRLARETFYVGGAGPVRQYSEGLYNAVVCNDYPQPYDMTAPISVRKDQYRQTIRDLKATHPRVFAPFTVREWVTSPVEYFDSCIEWPRPSRVDPPVPPGATFPDVPTLVLAGDIDSLTSPEGAKQTAAAFPNSTYVEVANMTHVSAIRDFGHCASRIVRRFVRTTDAGDTSCAGAYPEIRVVDRFVRDSNALDWGPPRRRAARIAAATVGDVIARWLGMAGFEGVGLRGGRFTTTGLNHVRWRLHRVRWVRDVAVSGEVDWKRRSGAVTASVRIVGPGAARGRLVLAWNSWDQLGRATARGRLEGRRVEMRFAAP